MLVANGPTQFAAGETPEAARKIEAILIQLTVEGVDQIDTDIVNHVLSD